GAMFLAAFVLVFNLASAPPIDYWDLDGREPPPRSAVRFLKSAAVRWMAILVFALCVGIHFLQRLA
ncbi:MAG: hypothetical protein KGJ64_00490, partial [Betaproteobacteria bacterium]|nr:hypothetical protein [Betaproteobacteria bacterium]